MDNIIELAIAYWRLEKWVANAPVEKKMAANSSLRTMKRFLDSNGVEIKDLTGQSFDYGMNLEVIHNDLPQGIDDQKAIISEMVKPMILQNGIVVSRGQVVIGLTVKNLDSNSSQLQEPIVDTEPKKIDETMGSKPKKCIVELLKDKLFQLIFLSVFIIFAILVIINLFSISNSMKENMNNVSEMVNNKDIVSIVFIYDDTNEVVERKNYYFGDEIIIPESIKSRPADNTYSYEFLGWVKEPKNAEKNEVFRATYTKKYIDYQIVFKNDDGTVISEVIYHYGDTVTIPDNLIKSDDVNNEYVFDKWDHEVTTVEKNDEYIATYKLKTEE